MSEANTKYKLMEVNSRDLEIPKAYQRRLNAERTAKIAAGFDERIANEPKVSYRNGRYYVFDGQHTISARKKRNGDNDLPILCKVYYNLSEQDEALLFARQTGDSAVLTPSAKLLANLHGEDTVSSAFFKATEETGLHIGFERGRGEKRIICINTALAEYKRAGEEIYKETLGILLGAWDGAPDSLRVEFIQGMARFAELYRKDYDRAGFICSLRDHTPKEIYEKAMADQELHGLKRFIRAFFDIYNCSHQDAALAMKF